MTTSDDLFPAPPLRLTRKTPREKAYQDNLVARLLTLDCVRGVLRLNSGATTYGGPERRKSFVAWYRLKTVGFAALAQSRWFDAPKELTAGLPDLMVLLVGGKIAWIEVKRPGEKPRASQETAIRYLRLAGFPVLVWTAVDSWEGNYQEALAFVRASA